MSASSLRLPNSLHERARELARSEGVSINQLVAAALAEKMSALLTEEYLGARAQRGSRTRFLAALAQVPAVEPAAEDALTPQAPGGRPQRPKARAKTGRDESRAGHAVEDRRDAADHDVTHVMPLQRREHVP